MEKKSNIILETSLQMFFYDHLEEMNKKSTGPLSNELIFYSSLVMNHFGTSKKFFEEVDGKVKDKILGIKLLEAAQLPKDKQKEVYRDIAETSLFICGYFSESLNKKIVDLKYYHDLGKSAYFKLNNVVPSFYDIPNFYRVVAGSFNELTNLMNLVSLRYASQTDKDAFFLITHKKKNAA